ncbi:sigma-70 family RNA polymerase sigma factor [Saccharibacillus sp. CPCC 101409]|uniref:sigma-70 family RNA polymerase sigma factor n=1 Tax=Saccharibacillus sp. CPCC 101409 TaxID=3058041 RepID=UPI0026733067|nr:sigma-70 family RNA polymerase sigma factor [Saccharibacillus sp. CPCC 101409]MDO3411776.1 sigma-70 family RNA polymerase sigma factor [Saccharibacillus sp. CPCC 101409]
MDNNYTESDAFRAVFLEYYPGVRRKLIAMVKNEAAAEDLAQEVFLRLYRNPPDDPRVIGAWLHRVLTRLAYDHTDKLVRQRKLQEKQERYFDREKTWESGEETLVRSEDRERMTELLGELPERDRQALLLRYSGYSYAEIAEEIRVNPPRVGSLLSRAADKLRKRAAGRSNGMEL